MSAVATCVPPGIQLPPRVRRTSSTSARSSVGFPTGPLQCGHGSHSRVDATPYATHIPSFIRIGAKLQSRGIPCPRNEHGPLSSKMGPAGPPSPSQVLGGCAKVCFRESGPTDRRGMSRFLLACRPLCSLLNVWIPIGPTIRLSLETAQGTQCLIRHLMGPSKERESYQQGRI